MTERLPTDHLHPATAATIPVTMGEHALRDGPSAAGLDIGDRISAGQAPPTRLERRNPAGRPRRPLRALDMGRNAVPLCHFHHRRVHDTGFVHARLPDGSVRFGRRT